MRRFNYIGSSKVKLKNNKKWGEEFDLSMIILNINSVTPIDCYDSVLQTKRNLDSFKKNPIKMLLTNTNTLRRIMVNSDEVIILEKEKLYDYREFHWFTDEKISQEVIDIILGNKNTFIERFYTNSLKKSKEEFKKITHIDFETFKNHQCYVDLMKQETQTFLDIINEEFKQNSKDELKIENHSNWGLRVIGKKYGDFILNKPLEFFWLEQVKYKRNFTYHKAVEMFNTYEFDITNFKF